MLEAEFTQRIGIGMLRYDRFNRGPLQRPELRRKEWCEVWIRLVHRHAQPMRVLSSVVEPVALWIPFETGKHAVLDDLDRRYRCHRHRQQQRAWPLRRVLVGHAGGRQPLRHIDRELPLHADIAGQQIEVRLADYADILSILRRRRLAKRNGAGFAGLRDNADEEARGVEAEVRNLRRSVVTRLENAWWVGDVQHAKRGVDMRRNRFFDLHAIDQPSSLRPV